MRGIVDNMWVFAFTAILTCEIFYFRDTKLTLKARERELSSAQKEAGDSQALLSRTERDLKASQTELRISREELNQKTEK